MAGEQVNTDPGLNIPTKILQNDLLSTDPNGAYQGSEAAFCFVHQGFSANLQVFMIHYVMSTTGLHSVYS
jgi:hypothetical protein